MSWGGHGRGWEQAADNSVPQVPIVLAGLAAAIVAFAVMGTYETAIDTIMVCFLEDEAENDDKVCRKEAPQRPPSRPAPRSSRQGIGGTDFGCSLLVFCLRQGYATFASGELKSFMSGTKSIADAHEAYVNSVRDAKTAKLRSNNESEAHLLQQTKGMKGKKSVRQAARKGKKGAKKHNKNAKKEANKSAADADEGGPGGGPEPLGDEV